MEKPTDYLKSVGIDIFLDGHNSYKLASTGFMDLTVETWQEGKNTVVSMCHYGEQNGDLMKDPDVLFKVEQETITYRVHQSLMNQVEQETITYREIQMDYTGYYSEDHAEIKDFMENTWVPNLIQQGHKVIEKDIEA